MRKVLLFIGLLLVFSGLASGNALKKRGGDSLEARVFTRISETKGEFDGSLDFDDQFGISIDSIGDLNEDGVQDLVVGAKGTDDGGVDNGGVWILFLEADGTILNEQKISETYGAFNGNLSGDGFGFGVAGIGDLNEDGNEDVVVGANNDDDGGSDAGAVWILFLNKDGTVSSHQKISDTNGGMAGSIPGDSFFGCSVASIRDLDGDGVQDIAVGSRRHSDGGYRRGAVYILFMKKDGTVRSFQKISDTQGNLSIPLENNDYFGTDVDMISDVNGDGVQDFVVGARWDDDGFTDAGALYLLFMTQNGTVKTAKKISQTAGGFNGDLEHEAQFGRTVDVIPDLDSNGVDEVLVGANKVDDGGYRKGAIWVLFLNKGGTVHDELRISDTSHSQGLDLEKDGRFGTSVAAIGDLNDNGFQNIMVGEKIRDDGGKDKGAVWHLGIEEKCSLHIPNVFTPNGDGKNDRFAVRSEHCGVKALRIYNRWGQLIYRQVNEQPSWDGRNPSGKKVPAGTYFFSVKIGDKVEKGQVTLIRDRK